MDLAEKTDGDPRRLAAAMQARTAPARALGDASNSSLSSCNPLQELREKKAARAEKRRRDRSAIAAAALDEAEGGDKAEGGDEEKGEGDAGDAGGEVPPARAGGRPKRLRAKRGAAVAALQRMAADEGSDEGGAAYSGGAEAEAEGEGEGDADEDEEA